jgi:polysaccharide biosynthesis/export protein
MRRSVLLTLAFITLLWGTDALSQEFGAGSFSGSPSASDGLGQGISPRTIQNLPADIQAQIPAELRALPGYSRPVETASPENGAAGQALSPVTERAFSRIERQYRSGYATELAEDLRQFGYELFDNIIPKASKLAVPGDGYLLGPGDKLRIRVWGSAVDAEFTGVVDRNGSINVPKIGIVPVAGVKFGQVETVIRREAEKYIQGININVALEELRSLEVYIVGSVRNPGLHLVPAFSTVLDGLLASGGVQKTGSLRSVGLYRGGKLLREIDLYHLLLHGDRGFDVNLENRDVIFVPRLAMTAAVSGAVKEEGIFELKGEKNLGELLQLTGGILPQSFTGRIHLRRYTENREFVIQDIDTAGNEKWRELSIQDGDMLELQYLPLDMPKVVRLEGHVWMPDVFTFEPGISLGDILTASELLKPDAVMQFALLHRYDPGTTRYMIQRFPLDEVFHGRFNLELQPHDRIEILSRSKIGISEEVTVQGAVWKPGALVFLPAMTLGDAIAQAGGEKFGARIHQIELSRQDIADDQVVTSHFTLNLADNAGFLLQPFDYILVPRVKDATAFKTVLLSGEVRYPGTYRIGDGERVSDLIQRAGGFLPDAYFFGAKYTSEKARVIQQQSIDKLIQELEIRTQLSLGLEAQSAASAEAMAAARAGQESLQLLLGNLRAIKAEGRVAIKMADVKSFRGSDFDFEVEEGDSLHIPKRPNFVATVGSVYSPSAYLHEPNKTVGYYLEKSGGPTKTADMKHAYVLRANGEVIAKMQGRRLFSRFESQKLMPGDTIVVPENLERVPYMRMVSEVADILFKIATTAGIAIAVL